MGGAPMARCKKNAQRGKAWICFQDESGISQQPSVRRTWAPRGKTPILTHSFNWKKQSVCAALGFRWDGQPCRLWFLTRPGSYTTESLIGFLKALRRHLRGRKAILVWDRLPAHTSRKMRAWLWSQCRWLRVEWLPGYAPELNPLEPLWGNVKGRELANRCAGDLHEATAALRKGLARVRRSDDLLHAFLRYAGLSF